MIEYLQILGQEVYKIVFLIVPILVSVANIGTNRKIIL